MSLFESYSSVHTIYIYIEIRFFGETTLASREAEIYGRRLWHTFDDKDNTLNV